MARACLIIQALSAASDGLVDAELTNAVTRALVAQGVSGLPITVQQVAAPTGYAGEDDS